MQAAVKARDRRNAPAPVCRIAIAVGDPNGIGPEIAVKAAVALAAEARAGALQLILVGDTDVVMDAAARYASGLPLTVLNPAAPRGALEQALDHESLLLWPVQALPAGAYAPGTLDARAGAATIAYARAAVDMAQSGLVQAVIGCPHSETAIHRAGIAFSGYPPLIAELTGGAPDDAFLMLVASGLRIAHVTLHESVASALGRLTPERVERAALAAIAATRRLGIAQPRLGLFGINPHAGEDGLFGDEDQRVTAIAAERLRAKGLHVEGPTGADLLLGQRGCDVYLAMFHDQGHIPIKLLSPLRASALTIGTPVLFSSVGHGCAFDIAGQGKADPASVIDTVRLLRDVRPAAAVPR